MKKASDQKALERILPRIRQDLEHRREHLEAGGEMLAHWQVTRERYADEDTPIHVVDQAFQVLNREGLLHRARKVETGFARGTGEWQPKVYRVRFDMEARKRALEQRQEKDSRTL